MKPEHKYAVPGAHHDQFNIDLGYGTPEGPGPAHYPTEATAFIGAADWIWIMAEANQQRSARGHDHEWDSFIYLDRGSGKYGFTTPEVHCRTEFGINVKSAGTRALAQLGNTRAAITGYIHSHPKNVWNTAPEVLSGVIVDSQTGEVSGDRMVAYDMRDQRWWFGLVTPRGAVKRIRILETKVAEIQKIGITEPPSEKILQLLRRNDTWQATEDRPAQGFRWQPGTQQWRQRAVEAAKRELAKLPQGLPLRKVPAGTCPSIVNG